MHKRMFNVKYTLVNNGFYSYKSLFTMAETESRAKANAIYRIGIKNKNRIRDMKIAPIERVVHDGQLSLFDNQERERLDVLFRRVLVEEAVND